MSPSVAEIEVNIRANMQAMGRASAELREHEELWRDKQPFLASRGYSLRPRFRQGWRPSWELQPDQDFMDVEGYWRLPGWYNIIDATRDSDGRLVCIKRVLRDGSEMQIATYLSSPPLSCDPRNRCAPVLDSFHDDDAPYISYIVMPRLLSMYEPSFEHVDDVFAFVEQALERCCRDKYAHGWHAAVHSRVPPSSEHPTSAHKVINIQDGSAIHAR